MYWNPTLHKLENKYFNFYVPSVTVAVYNFYVNFLN